MEFAIDIRARCCLADFPFSESSAVFGLFRGGCQGIFGQAIFGQGILGLLIERIIDRRRGTVRRLVAVVDLGELLPRLLGFALPVPHAAIEPSGSPKPDDEYTLSDAP